MEIPTAGNTVFDCKNSAELKLPGCWLAPTHSGHESDSGADA